MEFITELGLFLAKTFSIVIAILIVVAGIAVIIASKGKDKEKNKVSIKKLNKKYDEMAKTLKQEILSKHELKKQLKQEKKQHKAEKKQARRNSDKKRIFVLNFCGDIKASELIGLREEITALLTIASKKDEVILNLESAGGMVHAYGLAASQLQRIRDKKIKLTVSVDKVAASGGYLMACVADHIIAAPFAIIGSIGVIAQMPNFNRLLKKSHIDYEQITAGEFKRTLTIFGENTDKARQKFQEDLEDIHYLFKDFIQQHRANLDLSKVATGEHWLGRRAKDLDLVDTLMTSDDYLMQASHDSDLYELSYTHKKKLGEKVASVLQMVLEKLAFISLRSKQVDNIF